MMRSTDSPLKNLRATRNMLLYQSFTALSYRTAVIGKNVRETTSNIGLTIEQALRGIEQANQEFLYGIFGDAQWSNKNKLSDRLLTDLIEHFSQYNLSNSNVEPDLLGQAYEYLIKHFADLTNKKAGEFYTPRSVVHLLGMILDPHEGETIYDPACGTGGMLLECVAHLKDNNEDYRTLKLYGQEKKPNIQFYCQNEYVLAWD